MQGKAKTGIFKKLGIVVVCLCVLSYAAFHFASLFAEEIGTVIVGPTEEKMSVTLGGYIFRDSQYITANEVGAVDYAVRNGEKVAVKDKLATVYTEGNLVGVRDTLAVLDEQIELLRLSVDSKPSVSALAELRKKASDAYYALMKQLASSDVSSLKADSTKLLTLLNSVKMISDSDFDIKGTLSELEAYRADLLAAGGENIDISTDRSGYFYTSVHGYESSFSGESARTLDADGFISLFETDTDPADTDNVIGKMSYDSRWYFASKTSVKGAERFTEGERYAVEFTGGGYFSIDMVLERVLLSSDEKSAVLVFGTGRLPDGFGFEHRQTAKVVTGSIRGIYVPATAIRRENFERVVYIIKGSVVEMRHIDVIYEGADYFIVSEYAADEERLYLESNDQLIVKGSNLFHGRILD